MGSPLAPVLANLFMGHNEKLWLENFQGSEILFYRRYVDDTFCLFHSEHDAIIFFVDSGLFSYFRSRLYHVSTKDKRGISYSKRTTFFESTIVSRKSEIILLIFTLPRFMYIPLLIM